MSETKFFEIRDRGTFIPAVATRYRVAAVTDSSIRDHRLLKRSGWGYDHPPVTLTHLSSRKASADPHEWCRGRTMKVAHSHIIESWGELKSGQVIDVQVILGEMKKPAASQL